MLLPLVLFVASQAAQPPTVTIPSWAGLAAKYDYKHLDLTTVANETTVQESGHTKITFTFKGTPGDTVHGVLLEPKGSTSCPVVVLLHGLGGGKDEMLKSFGSTLLAQGIGCAAIDAPGHGERQTPEDLKVMQGIGVAYLASKGDLLKAMVTHDPGGRTLAFLQRATIDGVLDNRHLLDYLTSRKDIDYRHVSVVGVSLGSITAAILGPVDSRVKNMALLVGGDPVIGLIPSLPQQYQEAAIAGSCSLYAPHFSGPVRMINANKDSIMPQEAAEKLYEAFPAKTKSISWYNSDHFLPPLAYEEAVQYITDQDKPGK